MKKKFLKADTIKTAVLAMLLVITSLFYSCSPTIQLTGTWHDQSAQPKKLNQIVVMALGKSLENRQLGENALVAQLKAKGFNAISSLSILPPDYQKLDSNIVKAALIKNNIDGALLVRVVSKSATDRYVPGTTYAGGYGGYYGGWGGYYTNYGYYTSPGYTVTDVEVLLETSLYDLSTGKLMWVGQSKSFTDSPTKELAGMYASQVVNDLVTKKVITP